MVAKYLAARPGSPPLSSSPAVIMSSSVSSPVIQQPLTSSSSGVNQSPFAQSRSPVQMGGFHEPPSPLNFVPPGHVGIGGKFIFKSNVIQSPGEMPPGAPFLLMKQPQVPQPLHNNQFPTDHGRVVLVAGRHMPSAASSSSSSSSSSPPNSQLASAQPSVPGHSTQLSSHGGQSVTSSLGIGGISSSSNSSSNRGGGVGGGEGGRRSANGGKSAAMTSREKKDLFTQRKQREFIPDNKKDDNYWDRRRRNNEAAKRSREKRRFNDMILEQRVIELTKENHILKAQLDAIKDKYNICGENLISLDQILSTMPTPDQVLNVNNAGHLTIASGLTTQHFRNFQLAREARGAESVITTGPSPSPAKKMKVSPKSEERSSSGGDDDEGNVVHRNNHSNGSSSSNSNELPPQPDSQRREQQHSSPEKDYYKRSVSPNCPAVRLVGASPLPLPLPMPLDKTSPPSGLINYSLRDIYYNNGSNGGPPGADGPSALMVNRPPHHPPPTSSSGEGQHIPHHQQHHLDRGESEFVPTFPYASSSSSGNVPVKYEEPDDGHHCGASPPYRPHPAHVPLKVHPGSHYFYDEQRRKRFEESTPPEINGENDHHEVVDREQQFMLLHRRQPEGAHLSQLELILNLSAKRDTEIDQRSMGEPEIHCTDRDSPVLIDASTKNHPNLLPLKLRHKANVKHDQGGPELRRVLMHGGGDEAMDEVDVDSHHSHPNHYPHHHHLNPHHLEQHNPRFDPYVHHQHLHLRRSPTEEDRQQQLQHHHPQHKTCPEDGDGRLVKTEDYDEEEDEDEELQHQQRIIESGNARRVHCCIEVEKLSNDDEEEKRYRAEVDAARASMSPKPNNNILKSQLARLENEMATIKNLMYMNTNQATAAAQ